MIDHIALTYLRRVLRRMKQFGVSNTELAKRMKVSRPYISKVLSADSKFSLHTTPLIGTTLWQPLVGGYLKHAKALKMDLFPELKINDSRMIQ